MYRCPELPFLPGYSFNRNIGKTRFPLSQVFDRLGDVRLLTNKLQSGKAGKIHERYPSIYCKGEVSELPGWIAFDKQVLTFELFFQETLQEVRNSPFQIRKCKLFFFLEDGTIKVVEPKVENSGIPQGTLIARQRIRFPPPKDDLFYDIIDFNVGREVELYGKVFKITNCDQFTRNFLNRLGIPVPDPITTPADPYQVNRLETLHAIFPKKPNRSVDTFGQFLKYDRKVLRFYGYWDDRDTLGGYLHDLMIHYYLADDTIEINEKLKENCGRETTSMFIRKGKLPKFFDELPQPGSNSDMVVLNVLGPNVQEGRYVVDPLRAGKQNVQYFKENDLAIGAAISVYGRKVVLTDCDPFTKEYYRTKYGLDDFSPTKGPPQENVVESVPLHQRKLPPWNGYGSFEDSAQNCITVEPKQIMRDFKKFLTLDREGMDSKILRFRAYMRSTIPDNCRRIFIISYFLCDNTISVYEIANKSLGATFMTRGALKLPGQQVYTSEPPDYYEPHHMFIGASVNFNGFHFVLTDADEYALRYMELHANEFPKSNINIIIDKVREKIKPIYKDFVAENMPKEQPVLPFTSLRQKLCKIMGEDWSEHEMITLARHFSAICRTQRHDRKFIRQLVLTELKRMLWDDLDRFKEYFQEYDINKTGFLPIKKVFTLIRACKLPLDITLIENMIQVLGKNKECEVDGQDLFCFLDRNYCPVADTVPVNVKTELWFASEPEPVAGKLIDWCAFIKALNLEEEFQKPIVIPKKQED